MKKPRPSKADHIPAHVKRAVWARDGGRCAYPLASGGVCGSTHRLEFDHIEPLARGGASTIENVRVACRWHNLHAARQVLGDEVMRCYAPRRRPEAPASGQGPRAHSPGGSAPP